MRRATTPTKGVSTRTDVLLFPAMREGRFYKFWVYIMASSTGTLYIGMTGFVDAHIFSTNPVKSMASRRNTTVIDWCITNNITTCMWQSAERSN
jgi:hypothetical protein